MIRFRQIEETDLEMLRDWRNSPEVRLICREYRLLNMDNQRTWFKNLADDKTMLMFVIENVEQSKIALSETAIGVCGWTFIDWRSRHGLVSFYVAGMDADESLIHACYDELHRVAFDEINMHTVRLEVYDFHPLLELYRNLGYTEVGRWREAYYHNGRYADIILFDLKSEEWRHTLNGK